MRPYIGFKIYKHLKNSAQNIAIYKLLVIERDGNIVPSFINLSSDVILLGIINILILLAIIILA